MRISANLIVRNEAHRLSRCLESLAGAVDEIVIVDTGSEDDTVSIARSFGAQIHTFAWIDDFAAARNVALEHSRGDWILSIDADEWLAGDQVRRFVRQAPSQNPPNVSFVPFMRIGARISYSNVRLFARHGTTWEYRVHEQIVPGAPGAIRLRHPDFEFGHDVASPEVKNPRNVSLLERMRDEAAPGSRARRHAIVHLARALKIPYGPEDAAQVEAAIDLAVEYDPVNFQLLIFKLYWSWIQAGDFESVNRVNQRVLQRGGRSPLVFLAQAIDLLERDQVTDARAAFERAMTADDDYYVREILDGLFRNVKAMLDAK